MCVHGSLSCIPTSIETFSKNEEECRDGTAKNHRNYIGAGMAVCRLHMDYTSNTISTSLFIHDKCRSGVTCVVLV